MSHLDVAHLTYVLPDGRVLLDDVSFRVGEGAVAALVGANGAGKTTLMRLIAGDLAPDEGSVTRSGSLGVMRQFVGKSAAAGGLDGTVHDLLVAVSPDGIQRAAHALEAAELAMMDADDEPTQMRYAQ
jgi:ATPase subunit of ABC transporter with duplicated ATPase domains